MRIAVFSCAFAIALSSASVAYAEGDDVPSTWMLQANPYDQDAAPATPTAPPPTTAPTSPSFEEGAAMVSFAVRTAAGTDIAQARVVMDGQILTEALQGWAVSIPAGTHVFEFRGPGYVAQEHTVTIHAGTIAELVTIALAPTSADASNSPQLIEPWNTRTVIFQPHTASLPETPTASPREGNSDPWLVTYIAGGVGIAALGIGTALGISASNQIAELRQSCAPTCSDSQLDSVRSKMAVADVAFGVGIVSGGLAVVWALTHPREDDRPAHAHVGFDVRGMAANF